MAIVYFARSSNKPKQQVPYIYFGVKGRAKKVIKGYIGDKDGNPKIFFKPGVDIDLFSYVTSIGGETTSIYRINYIVHSTRKYIDDKPTDPQERLTGRSADISNKYSLYNGSSHVLTVFKKTGDVYLNSSSNQIFRQTILEDNNMKIFRFDKIVHFYQGFYNSKASINISNLKYFNNVKNMDFSFAECTKFIGNPVYAPKVTNMDHTYLQCYNISGPIYIGPDVTYACYAYCDAGIKQSGLDLNNILVAKNNPINLSYCFQNSQIKGNLYINTYNNTKTKTNLEGIFAKRKGTELINIYMSNSKSLAELNTFLSTYKIYATGEKHIKREDYIEILSSSSVTYNIRFYNYIPQ